MKAATEMKIEIQQAACFLCITRSYMLGQTNYKTVPEYRVQSHNYLNCSGKIEPPPGNNPYRSNYSINFHPRLLHCSARSLRLSGPRIIAFFDRTISH